MIVKCIIKIEKWKLEIQRAKSQFYCPHEYSVILEHRCNGMARYDIYCPICHSTKENLKDWQWTQIKGIRATREAYEKESVSI